MKSDDATLAAFAQYLIKFVRAYAQQGITIEAISPQNEPNYRELPDLRLVAGHVHEVHRPVPRPPLAAAGQPTKIMLGTCSTAGPDPPSSAA